MITIKLPIQNEIDVSNYINQYNNVVRFAYNRFHENIKYKQSDVEKLVKNTMNNIEMIDASLIKSACDKAKSIKNNKIIFGGKYNWYNYVKKLITKEEFKENRNIPLQVRGSKSDNKGNRKFSLDIIDNNRVIFKPNKNIKIYCNLPRLSKSYKKQLYKLEELCNENKTYFTCSLTNKFIYISFEETILKEKNHNFKKNRILSIDLNPNYITYSICDYDKKDKINILYKEIISLKEINDFEKTDKYKNNSDKKDLQKYISNKRRFELFEISKHIIQKSKQYNVESLVIEKLNIKSSEKSKGKRFNKLCNNQWIRNHFVSNLKKRCNIVGIIYQEIVPQYSSFIGQMNNENEYDSIAASLELGRRGNLYIRRYIKEESKHKVDIVFPEFNLEKLSNRWKEEIISLMPKLNNWKDFYYYVKKSKHSYRFLFKEVEKFYRLNSTKSKIKFYDLLI